MLFGYVRVSTRDQNEERQLDALEEFKIPRRNLYVDKQSGKDFERPAYIRMMKRLREGDLLIVKSIDRLGRNYAEIIEQWRIITRDRKADVRVIDMPLLDTTRSKDLLGTFIADLVLQVLSYCAQAERENIKQRQAEGIASAKMRGVRFGRPKKELPPNFELIYENWRQGGISTNELESRCGMTISVIYKKLRERRTPPPLDRI